GNNRMLRYNNNFIVSHTLHWQGATYYLRLVENDSTRLVSFMMEYEVDYSKPIRSSWKLTRQYEPSVTINLDPNKYFKSLVKLSNGRTYGTLRTGPAFNDGTRSGPSWFQVYELTDLGARATGIWMSGHTYSIWPDGSLMQFISKRGGASTVIKYALTGFDGQQNPQWAKAGITIAHINSIGSEGVNGGIIHRLTNDNKLIIFDPNAPNNGFQPYGLYSQGFHIGAIKFGDVTSQKWLWRTAPSTTPSYSADYPSDGKFDIGNGVKMPGGEAKTVSDFIVWNHHGEFWKQGQTNMHHLMYKNGLQIMQFGVAVSRAQNVLPKGYPGMAGNALTIATTRVGDNLFLWHGDEGYHSGIHRWKISGLNTLETFVIPLGGEQKTAPVANFSAADTVGCLTLSAKFSDRSTAGSEAITNWLWDFGDGTTSTEQHPTHVFKKSGSYTVSLKVTSQSGTTNTVTKSGYIQVTEG
ncbi:MAG: PKD domain-containing protein, partial [Chitinophagaceae bacterium]